MDTSQSIKTKTSQAISTSLALGLVGSAAVFAFAMLWFNFDLFQPKTNTSAAVSTEPSGQDLTVQLLRANRDRQPAQALNVLATKRQTALTTLIDSDPMAALSIALPSDVRQELVAAGVDSQVLEVRHERLAGIYIEEFDLTLDADGVPTSEQENRFMELADGTKLALNVPGYQFRFMHGSTIALDDAVVNDDVVVASSDSLAVVNEVMPGHTVKKVAGVTYKFQSDPDVYSGWDYRTLTLDYRLRQPIFTDTLSTRKLYFESSYGQLVLNGKNSAETGDVYGEYTIPDGTACSVSSILAAVKTQAQAAGADLSGYDFFVLLGRGGSSCLINKYSGSAYIAQSSKIVAANLAHEMGHWLGISHENSYACVKGNGQRVTLSTTCSTYTYGGGWDVMGGINAINQVGQMNDYHKQRLNWLGLGRIQTITAAGDYQLAPIEQSAGVIALRIPRTGTSQTFTVDFRQPIGDLEGHFAATDSHFNGIGIRLLGGFADTGLLDAEPEATVGSLNTGFTDYTLKLNRTFVDQVSGVSITPISLSSTGATVRVAFGAGTCVRGAPTLTISPSSQWGYANLPLAYSMTLKNNDSSVCAASTFNLSSVVPAGWSINPATSTELLSPGASVTRTVTVTSAADALDGFLTFSLTAVNASVPTSTATASATYVVQPPDTAAPTVTISSPANGATLKGKNFKVQTSASDTSGIAKIEISVDGVLKQTCNSAISCAYTGLLSSLTAGNHTITAAATDASPNANTNSTSITVKR